MKISVPSGLLLTQNKVFVGPDSNDLFGGVHWNGDRQDFVCKVCEDRGSRRHKKRLRKETSSQRSSFRDVVRISYQTGDVRETAPHKTISPVIPICQKIPTAVPGRLNEIGTRTYIQAYDERSLRILLAAMKSYYLQGRIDPTDRDCLLWLIAANSQRTRLSVRKAQLNRGE